MLYLATGVLLAVLIPESHSTATSRSTGSRCAPAA